MQRVLIVEDEEDLRELYKEVLEMAGFLADAFETGEEGLKALSEQAYDILLLDILLPDKNGIDVLQTIKQDPKLLHLPVVLLTNLEQDLLVKKGMELGAVAWWVKVNYTPDRIVSAVRDILAKHSS